MSDPVIMKLKILTRAELTLAQIRARAAAERLVFFIVAGIFVLFGLVMFNLAGFHALRPGQGPALAALFVALVDVAVAIVVIVASTRAGTGSKEEKLALKIRDLASTELNHDMEAVKAEVDQIVADVRNIRSGVKSLSDSAWHTITPLLTMLIKAMRKD